MKLFWYRYFSVVQVTWILVFRFVCQSIWFCAKIIQKLRLKKFLNLCWKIICCILEAITYYYMGCWSANLGRENQGNDYFMFYKVCYDLWYKWFKLSSSKVPTCGGIGPAIPHWRTLDIYNNSLTNYVTSLKPEF